MPRSLRLIAGLALLAACSGSPTIDPYQAERQALVVEEGDLEDHVLLSGTIEAAESTELKVPRTSSWQLTIRKLAEDGSRVDKGAKLVEFDNSAITERLNDQELAIVRADNELAAQRSRAAVELADKELEVERQRVEVAKAELDANVPRALISRREWEDKRLVLERARTALANAEDDLAGARKGLALVRDVKKIDYDKAVRNYERTGGELDALVLTAPTSGVFVVADHPWFGRRLQVGDTVRPGFLAARVSDLGVMKVTAQLSDVDDGRVRVGQSADCVLDAYPDRVFKGEVSAVSEIARKPGESSTRSFFEVTVTLADNDAIMRPGMSVRVDVQASVEKGVIIAPRAGLLLDGETPRARLADGSYREVDVGRCTPRRCSVTQGLKAGERLRYGEDVR